VDRVDQSRISLHLAAHPRALRHPLPLLQLGHLPAKRYWVDGTFEFVAFSIVLSGSGRMSVAGESLDVVGPCVLCEYPGPRFLYGPDGAWDETFFNYDRACLPLLTEIGLVRPGRFLWPLRNASRVRGMLRELSELAFGLDRPGALDRLDRLALSIVSETLLYDDEPSVDETDRQLQRVRAHFETHYGEPIDYAAVAKKFGLSFTTFRRHWARQMQKSPARFVHGVRMKHACRLLCETELPIADIARRVGFDDPLYLSKLFRREMDTTARAYRQKYGMHRPLAGGPREH
jgi:AraC-like DNA-binding protein